MNSLAKFQNQQLANRCYLCEIPKPDYSLISSFSEPVCRGCVNYEGPDQVEPLLAAARLSKEAGQAQNHQHASFGTKRPASPDLINEHVHLAKRTHLLGSPLGGLDAHHRRQVSPALGVRPSAPPPSPPDNRIRKLTSPLAPPLTLAPQAGTADVAAPLSGQRQEPVASRRLSPSSTGIYAPTLAFRLNGSCEPAPSDAHHHHHHLHHYPQSAEYEQLIRRTSQRYASFADPALAKGAPRPAPSETANYSSPLLGLYGGPHSPVGPLHAAPFALRSLPSGQRGPPVGLQRPLDLAPYTVGPPVGAASLYAATRTPGAFPLISMAAVAAASSQQKHLQLHPTAATNDTAASLLCNQFAAAAAAGYSPLVAPPRNSMGLGQSAQTVATLPTQAQAFPTGVNPSNFNQMGLIQAERKKPPQNQSLIEPSTQHSSQHQERCFIPMMLERVGQEQVQHQSKAQSNETSTKLSNQEPISLELERNRKTPSAEVGSARTLGSTPPKHSQEAASSVEVAGDKRASLILERSLQSNGSPSRGPALRSGESSPLAAVLSQSASEAPKAQLEAIVGQASATSRVHAAPFLSSVLNGSGARGELPKTKPESPGSQANQPQLRGPYKAPKCLNCRERLEDRHFVQCPTNDIHKFCFACSKDSIEKQQSENKKLKISYEKSQKCFLPSEPSPWTFMSNEIDTIFRESHRASISVSVRSNGQQLINQSNQNSLLEKVAGSQANGNGRLPPSSNSLSSLYEKSENNNGNNNSNNNSGSNSNNNNSSTNNNNNNNNNNSNSNSNSNNNNSDSNSNNNIKTPQGIATALVKTSHNETLAQLKYHSNLTNQKRAFLS